MVTKPSSDGCSTESEKIFSQKELPEKGGWRRYRAVSSGKNFRGCQDENLVVHGHGDAPIAGRVGLLIEGTGYLRLDELEVHPLKDH